MDKPEVTRRRGWGLTIVLVVSTLLSMAAFPMLLLALAMSPMLFDPPGSQGRILPWLMMALVAVTPFACVAGITGGWIAFVLRHVRTACILALLPLVLLLIYGVSFGPAALGVYERRVTSGFSIG